MLPLLKALSPTQFENLVFDLVTSAGLLNGVWRTPGSDQGRDIEGTVQIVDFSGAHSTQQWYVECKRYDSSVDWPTLWSKIAYADSHHADYLLLVTTAMLSPTCKTEIARWNADSRLPRVRFWDGTTLATVLLRFPAVIAKYGLSDDANAVSPAFVELSEQLAKQVQAALGQTTLTHQTTAELECAAATAELLTARLSEFAEGRRRSLSPFSATLDAFVWMDVTGDIAELGSFDRYGLRALLAFLRYTQHSTRLSFSISDGSITLPLPSPPLPAAALALRSLATWADVELTLTESVLTLRRRAA